MFENVDGRTDDGRTTDARVIGILIAHLGAFGSGELKMFRPRFFLLFEYLPIFSQKTPSECNPIYQFFLLLIG